MTFFNHLNLDPPEPGAVSREQATRLLSVGVVGPRRPVDDLIERLHREAGGAWFERVVDSALREAIGREGADLLAGRVSLDELGAAKEAAKRAMRSAIGRDEATGATAMYFAAIAGALAHHGECITSRGRDDLTVVLVDLAAAAPPPWRALLERALER